MAVECSIVGLTQGFDFEANSTTTYLLLRLSDGTTVHAAVDDAVASTVVALQVKQSGVPEASAKPSAPPAPARKDHEAAGERGTTPLPDDDAGDARIFGGDIEPDDSPMEPLPEAAPSPPPVQSPALPKPAQRTQQRSRGRDREIIPSRTVPRDVNDYPKVAGVDPHDLTSEGGIDEDGVGSV